MHVCISVLSGASLSWFESTPVCARAVLIYHSTDDRATCLGVLCGYGCSMSFLAYHSFVTGQHDTLMSKVTCCTIGPVLLFLNYNAALGGSDKASSD